MSNIAQTNVMSHIYIAQTNVMSHIYVALTNVMSNIYAELYALVNKPSGDSAGASDLKY